MRVTWLVPLLVLPSCSSEGPPAALTSPSAQPTTVTTSSAPVRTPPVVPTVSRAPRRTASPSASPTRVPRTYAVDMVDGERFSPSAVRLRAGDELLVTDQDPLGPHDFTVGALGVRSGQMSQGDTFRYRFNATGTFRFVCTLHESSGMTGTLTVTR
ncbi:MAG TPA: plastocyanin/azurin family copper-binding protein [Mycobacteriales bacterium]|nr:plastocyanin/azurin family copper-binding protein [Mycobacteriales bacterium]